MILLINNYIKYDKMARIVAINLIFLNQIFLNGLSSLTSTKKQKIRQSIIANLLENK